MRVLYCTDTYPPQVNGVSVVTAISVEGLSERGWECAVIAPRYPDEAHHPFDRAGVAAQAIRLSVPSMALPVYPDIRFAAPAYARVLRVVRDFKPHLIHAQTEFMLGRLGQMAARATKTPLVTSYHTDFAKYTTAYGMPWLRGRVAAYIRNFHRRAQRTYTPSGPARDDLLRMGVAHADVWGCGVDIDVFHPRRRQASLRTALGVPDNAFLFTHVGRLAHEKNVETLLDAFRLLCERLPRRTFRLVIAGTGPCERELRTRSPQGVTFLGHLDRRTTLPELYASSDAFLFSSLTETLGLVVLEAMASGIPVVAAPAGGVADHLRHEVNGLAYTIGDTTSMARAMADQLERLAQDELLHARLVKGARATAERLSWAAEFDRLDTSYREVITEVITESARAPLTQMSDVPPATVQPSRAPL